MTPWIITLLHIPVIVGIAAFICCLLCINKKLRRELFITENALRLTRNQRSGHIERITQLQRELTVKQAALDGAEEIARENTDLKRRLEQRERLHQQLVDLARQDSGLEVKSE